MSLGRCSASVIGPPRRVAARGLFNLVAVCLAGCALFGCSDIVVAMAGDGPGSVGADGAGSDGAASDGAPGDGGGVIPNGKLCQLVVCNDPARPVCEPLTGDCRPCQVHRECPQGLCTLSGRCPTADEIGEVDSSCSQTGDGSAASPFCSLDDAAGSDKPHLRLKPGTYGELVLERSAEVYGEPGVVLRPGSQPCELVDIDGSGIRVVLSRLTIEGGVVVEQGSLILDRVVIGPSDCVGLTATLDATVSVNRTLVAGNAGGGIEVSDGAASAIVNTFVVGNGPGAFGGVRLDDPGSPQIFVNNTVADNEADSAAGGIVCAGGDAAIANTIVWGNDTDSGGSQHSDRCGLSYSAVQAVAPPSGPGNINADPEFTGSGSGAAPYHLSPDSPCRNAGTTTGDTPADDFDGEIRDGQPDIGADEVPGG